MDKVKKLEKLLKDAQQEKDQAIADRENLRSQMLLKDAQQERDQAIADRENLRSQMRGQHEKLCCLLQ